MMQPCIILANQVKVNTGNQESNNNSLPSLENKPAEETAEKREYEKKIV